MFPQQPATPQEQSIEDDRAAQSAIPEPRDSGSHAPIDEQDGWLEDHEELPRRPRRRVLSPIPLALLALLLTACGFIGGVLVEKGQSGGGSASAASAGSGLAARFAALRGAAGGGAAAGAGAGTSAGGFAARARGGGGAATAGQVAYLSGHTLYVTTSEGNTVRVSTTAATSVEKTVNSTVKAIQPGETVTVTGSTGANGAVSAASIRVGSPAGGSLAGLLGAGGGSSGRAAGGASSPGTGAPTRPGAGGGGGEPALFGNGG
jgi:hypothetical protein